MIRYTFITAIYGCHDKTKLFLQSFLETVALPVDTYEFLMVDDCSEEEPGDLLEGFSELPIRMMRNDENMGFGASNNRAVREARGEILILLNNDLVLLPGWLEPMLAGLQQLEAAGAIGNIQVNLKNRLLDHVGVAFNLDGVPFHARKNRKRYRAVGYTEWPAVTAACMVIRRDVFCDVGGFDVAFRNGSEDIDLCLRLHQKGYCNYVANWSRVYHFVSSSPGRHDYNEQNIRLLKARWAPVGQAFARQLWPREYLGRYARHWWKASPLKVIYAFFLLCLQYRQSLTLQNTPVKD